MTPTAAEPRAFHSAAINMAAAAQRYAAEFEEINLATQVALDRLKAAQTNLRRVIPSLTEQTFSPVAYKKYQRDAAVALNRVTELAKRLDKLSNALQPPEGDEADSTSVPLVDESLRQQELAVIASLKGELEGAQAVLELAAKPEKAGAAAEKAPATEVAPRSKAGVMLRLRDFLASPVRFFKSLVSVVTVGLISTGHNVMAGVGDRSIIAVGTALVGGFFLAVIGVTAVGLKFLFVDMWRPLSPQWVIRAEEDAENPPVKEGAARKGLQFGKGIFSPESGHVSAVVKDSETGSKRVELTTEAEHETDWILKMWNGWDSRMVALRNWLHS